MVNKKFMARYSSKSLSGGKAVRQFLVLPLLVLAVLKPIPADADVKSETPLLDKALTITESVADSKNRIKPLQEIAVAYGARGKKTEASAVWDELLKAARKIKHAERRDATLLDISQGYASVENFSSALKTAESITSPYWQTLTWTRIARHYVAAGQAAQALQLLPKVIEVAERIKPRSWIGIVLAHVAEIYAQAGEINAANDLLQRIPAEYPTPPLTWAQIAIRYNAIGEPDQALKILRPLPENSDLRENLIRILANPNATDGQLKEFLKIARSSGSHEENDKALLPRSLALIAIAHEYISRGKTREAVRILSAVGKKAKKPSADKHASAKALVVVAREYGRVGMEKQAAYYLSHALKKASGVTPDIQAELLGKAAIAYVELGRTTQALDLVKKLDTVYSETKIAIDQTDRAIRNGTKKIRQQITTFLHATNVREKLEDSHYTLKVLGAIGRKHIENGEEEAAAGILAKAARTVKPQDTAQLKASKLVQLSREYARIGQEPAPPELAYLDTITPSARAAN